MFIRAYLRASTKEQDANRAKNLLVDFVSNHNKKIATFYAENITGTKLERPELMRLIEESSSGDIILVESIDRLTRLNTEAWEKLKLLLTKHKIYVVAIDIPSSHILINGGHDDRIMELINNLLLDMAAHFAHRDFERRKQITRQGIEKAKASGKYKGKQPNQNKRLIAETMFNEGKSAAEVSKATGYTERWCFKIKNKMELGENKKHP